MKPKGGTKSAAAAPRGASLQPSSWGERDTPRVERMALSSQVSKIILEGLLEGRLRPGDRLVENDLADLLKVSRSPIREALTELAQSGIIVREPGRGGRIREWTKQDLEDLFGVRAVLEGYAARLVAQRFDLRARAPFDQIVAKMERASAAQDYLAMVELDVRFHEMLWRSTRNPLLEQVLEGLSQQFRLFLTLNWKFHGGLEEVAGNHRKLLDALATKDPAAAALAMHEHVVVEKMIAALQSHEEALAEEPRRTKRA